MFKTLSLALIMLTTLMAREPEWEAAYVVTPQHTNITYALWKNNLAIRCVFLSYDFTEHLVLKEVDLPDFPHAPYLQVTTMEYTLPSANLPVRDWKGKKIGEIKLTPDMPKEAWEYQLSLTGTVHSVDVTIRLGDVINDYLKPPYLVGDKEYIFSLPVTKRFHDND